MASDGERSNVRVEWDAAPGSESSPDIVEHASGGGGSGRALGLLAVLVLVAGGLWWAARPGGDEPEDAATASTTTSAALSTTAAPFESAVDTSPLFTTTTEAAEAVPPIPNLLVRGEVGWLAYGFDQTAFEEVLLRSTDGEVWTPIDSNLDMDIVHELSFEDGVYRVAARSFEETGGQLQVLESADGISWTNVRYFPLGGEFQEREVSMEKGRVATSANRVDDLIELPFLTPFLANEFGIAIEKPVCVIEASELSRNPFRFKACDRSLVAEVPREQVEAAGMVECLSSIQSSSTSRDVIFQYDTDLSMVETEIDGLFSVNSIRTVDDGVFVTTTASLGRLMTAPGESCAAREAMVRAYNTTGGGDEGGVLFVDREGTVTRIRDVPSDFDRGFGAFVVPAAEGGTYLLDGATVQHADAGSTDFEQVADLPAIDMFISAIPNTEWLFWQTIDTASGGLSSNIRRFDEPASAAIELPQIGEATYPIIVTDDYAILIAFGPRGTLVKVDLD